MKQINITSLHPYDNRALSKEFGGDLLFSELINILTNLSYKSKKALIYNSIKYIKKIKG